MKDEHEELRSLIAGYIDGELTGEERARLQAHLALCRSCREELEAHERLKEVTDRMKLITPPKETWERYWDDIYNRLERRFGWIMLSLGAIILLGYGLYSLLLKVLPDFWTNPDIALPVKIGTIVLGLGLTVMFVSVLRERLFTRKDDPYKEVKR